MPTAVVHPNAMANALFNAHEFGKQGEVSINVAPEGAVRCYGRSDTAMVVAFVYENEDGGHPSGYDFDPMDEVAIDPAEATALQSALRKKSKAAGATISVATDGDRLVVMDGEIEEANLPTLGMSADTAMAVDEEAAWAVEPPWGEREGGALFLTPSGLTPLTRIKPAPAIVGMRQPRVGRTIAFTAGAGVYGLTEAVAPGSVTDQKAIETTPWLRPAEVAQEEA